MIMMMQGLLNDSPCFLFGIDNSCRLILLPLDQFRQINNLKSP